MASPIIGNYGVFEDTSESTRPGEAFILRDLTTVEGDQRQAEDLTEYLTRNDIPGIYGIDTRALTLLIREYGTMLGLLTDGSKEEIDMKAALDKIQQYDGSKLVPMVSSKNKMVYPAGKRAGIEVNIQRMQLRAILQLLYRRMFRMQILPVIQKPSYRIALIDFGVKQNIIWNLVERDCEVTTYPWDTKAEEILR